MMFNVFNSVSTVAHFVLRSNIYAYIKIDDT